jgi:hypothetical protein
MISNITDAENEDPSLGACDHVETSRIGPLKPNSESLNTAMCEPGDSKSRNSGDVTISSPISSPRLPLHFLPGKSSISSTQGLSQHQRPKTIRFAPKIKVQQIPHIRSMPQDLVDTVWYNQQDYANIKKSYTATVRLMMRGLLFSPEQENSEHCTRGLGYRTKEGSKLRRKVKLSALIAVIEEQGRQFREGVCDPEKIAKVYKDRAATKSQTMAFVQGLKDEQEIQDCLHDDDLSFSQSSDIWEDEEAGEMHDVSLGDINFNVPSQPPSPSEEKQSRLQGILGDTPLNTISSASQRPEEKKRFRPRMCGAAA